MSCIQFSIFHADISIGEIKYVQKTNNRNQKSNFNTTQIRNFAHYRRYDGTANYAHYN